MVECHHHHVHLGGGTYSGSTAYIDVKPRYKLRRITCIASNFNLKAQVSLQLGRVVQYTVSIAIPNSAGVQVKLDSYIYTCLLTATWAHNRLRGHWESSQH